MGKYKGIFRLNLRKMSGKFGDDLFANQVLDFLD